MEATEAWNGLLFDVWIACRDLVAEGLREPLGLDAVRQIEVTSGNPGSNPGSGASERAY